MTLQNALMGYDCMVAQILAHGFEHDTRVNVTPYDSYEVEVLPDLATYKVGGKGFPWHAGYPYERSGLRRFGVQAMVLEELLPETMERLKAKVPGDVAIFMFRLDLPKLELWGRVKAPAGWEVASQFNWVEDTEET